MSDAAKPIKEIWWCAINPGGVPVWPFLELRKRDCREILDREIPGWKKAGWRITKLKVTEIGTNDQSDRMAGGEASRSE